MLTTHSAFRISNRRKTFKNISIQFVATYNSPRKKLNTLYLFLMFLQNLVSHYNNTISTTIYKKPNHTDRYLHYSSHPPKQQKLAITHCLHNRISSHISDPMKRKEARKDTCHTLQRLPLQTYLPCKNRIFA